jgi:DNA-binding beta-propeller fold protein YncE
MDIKLRIPSSLRLLVTMVLAVVLGFISPLIQADSLYIGDGGDDSVKRFDASTGNYLGNFVDPSSNAGLKGPRGMIFTNGRLLVANQNAGEPYNGEVLGYNRRTGAFLDAIVPCKDVAPFYRTCDPNAPLLPRGILRGPERALYVANYTKDDSGPFLPGDVGTFDIKTGLFLGSFDTTPFPSTSFFPRGLVRGPDGLIYVSVTGDQGSGDGLTGRVLRFNPRTGKLVNTFVNNPASNPGSGCTQHLHRPEGLVFGPDNNLYVTSFRANASDTDKILVFNKKGQCLDQKTIVLDAVGQPRSFAQSLLFGPNDRLFVPINNTGEVRRYNVKTKTYDIFIPAGGNLGTPWFMTFGETDPSTLEYDD